MQLWLATVLTASVTGVLTAPAVTVVVPGRQADFASAAREFGVPESVLLGVAYLESRWDANGGRPSTAGGYGPMHLVDAFPEGDTLPLDALGDPRGDDARPMSRSLADDLAASAALRTAAPRTTLPEAGRLAGVEATRLRDDPAANIRAGAALLASYQDRPSTDPVDWRGAVARYSGSDDPVAAGAFADEVFAVMEEGVQRVTDDGEFVRLDPVPSGDEGESQADPDALPTPSEELDTDAAPVDDEATADTEDQGSDTDDLDDFPAAGPKAQPAGPVTECPTTLTCEWMPAAHKRFGKKKNRDYGNHDHLSRSRAVDYIVIHDTEGSYQGIPSMIRNPKYVSWHYTIRSRDGHVAQHVPTNDIAWHAGNWDVNTRSIGIEHEGYLAKGGAWYTEAMYRSSARLVRFLADKHHVPLNRAHILGHDNVPGTSQKTVAGMHEDPGPYWDWAHYFELMNKPFKAAKNGDSIIIRPSYTANRPHFTGCVSTKAAQACPAHGAATVWLHTSPSATAPLVTDLGKHPGKPSTYSVYDHSARASTGQRYAVAGRQGDWTAIWYLGQKAWFLNPAAAPTAIPAKGPMVTPLSAGVKVYGRAYPEKSAYKSASYQPLTPLKYRIGPGQTYTVGDTITGSYYAANAFNPARHVTTTGKIRYHQIQLGHRVMFVMAKDVRMIG
ncbi:N-acetylmuramoyl-L-alanine amidase [Nonomuraea solani]|uniref:N-acetylmuramoyl-L-alanine amidase n=1 Tax=Nonomuraea solani TaxID=1144553 RepID=A0A1H5YFV9_9ACTN|nr:N-acetylmuramoyl-L-alanine amidase [Nonomuraea solani]SEG22550.1 N-acetylmuramoyl-L-alanine amidase [Nonomuraea solani]